MSVSGNIYIALGGNLPFNGAPVQETLSGALDNLDDHGVRILKRSSWWVSPAWPDPDQPEYINAVAAIGTAMDPLVLLETLHMVESVFGRQRVKTNGNRTIDLDLIDYQGRVRDTNSLILPHPRAHKRSFVLLPFREIAPGWKHPVTDQHISELIDDLDPAERNATRKA